VGTKSETQTSTMDPRVAAQTDQLTSFANQLANSQFDPYTGKRVADLTPEERQALSGYSALTLPSEFQEVSDIYRGMATRTPQERQADIDAYTQQYTSNVIDPTMAALNRQRAQQKIGEEADIIGANAFGSGRRDVYEGARQGEFEAAMGQTIGGLQAQGYQQAVNRADLEDQMKMGAAQALGGQAGQALQAQMGLLGGQLQAAALPRSLEQQDLEYAYQDFIRKYEDPFKKFGVLQGTQSVMPQGYGTTTTTTRDPMGQAANMFSALGSAGEGFAAAAPLLGFSDIRLKENLKSHSKLNGVNFYTWDWNEAAKAKGLKGNALGVVAQELEKTHPHLITRSRDGYRMVDYSGLYQELGV
jgi:hypothetical protein